MAGDTWTPTPRPASFGSDAPYLPEKSGAEGVQSIERATRILSVLSSVGRAGAPLARIVTLGKLHKSTTHRILCALLDAGLIEQDVDTRNYRLGAQISVLGAVMGAQFDLRAVGKDVLDRLASITGDAVYWGVRTHYDGLCLDLREGEHKMPLLRLHINECWPLGIGAFSIALLAFLPDDEVNAIIERNATYLGAQQDITPEYIHGQVQITRERGYAASRNLGNLGMAAIAVPVFDPHWRPMASLCITTTLERFSAARERDLANLLIKESRQVTQAWCELGSFSRPVTWRQGLTSQI